MKLSNNSCFVILIFAVLIFRNIGWGTKFGMIKCRTSDIPKFQNYEY